MERLWALPEPGRGTTPPVLRATLATCSAFTASCPNIVELGIPLEDALPGAIHRTLMNYRRRPRTSKLKLLGVGPSYLSIMDVPAISALLSLWFPVMTAIKYDEPETEPKFSRNRNGEMFTADHCWRLTCSATWECFKVVREQERRWQGGILKRCRPAGNGRAADPPAVV